MSILRQTCKLFSFRAGGRSFGKVLKSDIGRTRAAISCWRPDMVSREHAVLGVHGQPDCL